MRPQAGHEPAIDQGQPWRTRAITAATGFLLAGWMALGPAAAVLLGQTASDGRIEVMVRDEAGAGVVNAVVRLPPSQRAVTTGSDGRAAFGNVAAGPYTLEVRRLGYEPAKVRGFMVNSGRNEHIVTLKALARVLPEMVIAERRKRLARVYERQDKGLGVVQFAEDLAPYRGMTADDILLFNGKLSAKLVAPKRCGRRVVYVDGYRTPPASWEKTHPPPSLSDFVRIDDIVAIEVHTSADHLQERFLYDDPDAFAAEDRRFGAVGFGRTMNPGAVPLSSTCRRIVMIWTRFYDGP